MTDQPRPVTPPEARKAPWTEDEVFALNQWQGAGHVHPFTCGTETCRAVLVATVRGWICAFCDYTQDWAHAFMLDGPPPNPFIKGKL